VAGVGTNIFASTGLTGGASLTTDGDSTALAADTYGPAAAGGVGPFSPRHGHGLGFWLAVAGVGVLVLVRQSLPR
jgi:hypothetical protein